MTEQEKLVFILIFTHLLAFVIGWIISGIIAVHVTVNNIRKETVRNELESKSNEKYE